MIYEGSAPCYYSSYQGCQLPGHLEYYPQAGKHRVYDLEVLSCGFTPECHSHVKMDVTVNGRGTYYCNLSEVNKNHFVGESNALTLVNGIMVKELWVGTTRFIVPLLNPEFTEQSIRNWVKQYRKSNQYSQYPLDNLTVFARYEGDQPYSKCRAEDHIYGLDYAMLRSGEVNP